MGMYKLYAIYILIYTIMSYMFLSLKIHLLSNSHIFSASFFSEIRYYKHPLKKRREMATISLCRFYCSFVVSIEGSFFSLNNSPIAPKLPNVSTAFDGRNTLFAGPFAISVRDSNDLYASTRSSSPD